MSTCEPTRRRFRSSYALGVGAMVAALFASSHAAASPEYPVALAGDLNLTTIPACTVCHQTLAGGTGTATKPFALYMRSRGLVSGSVTALAGAVEALKGEAAAGVPEPKAYLAALQAGNDPNGGDETSAPPPIDYGCGAATIAPRSTGPDTTSAWALSALAVIAVGIARKSRRR